MSDANPWNDPAVAAQQRAIVDKQLEECPWPAHFTALAEAVRATNCPGDVLEVGAASGYGREILDRAGVPYRSFVGYDVSAPAIDIARERCPESTWVLCDDSPGLGACVADVVIDGCTLMHAEDWRGHLAALCGASRRWLVLHRIPLGERTVRDDTEGYGKRFPAWRFGENEVIAEMASNEFVPVGPRIEADGGSATLTFARPRYWATYFDAAYLPRARVMWESLQRHGGPVVLEALCWDDEAHAKAREAGMVAHRPGSWETAALPGSPRSRVERMWTCGSRFLSVVARMINAPVTYVDADVMFHSSPEPLFGEWGGAAAGIIPHGFAPAKLGLPGPTLESHRVFGKYNVGIVHVTQPVAEDWADKCREWCYDAVDRGRYGDQAYLDLWPVTFDAIATEHPGACLGPWAVHTRALDVRDGVIHFGNKPLIAYHYSALKLLPHGDGQLTRPEYALTRRQEHILYAPYLRALENARP